MSHAAPRAKVVWTYQDYRLLPDDGHRYEVIDGDLHVTPSPSILHQTISKRIGLAFMLQIERPGHGIVYFAPLDVIFSETRTVQPDLVVLRRRRRNIITGRAIEGAPDIVVEIISPSTGDRDRGLKRKLYASEGVAEYWLVDPEQHGVEVLTLSAEGYQLFGRFGPGQQVRSATFELELEIDEIFAEL